MADNILTRKIGPLPGWGWAAAGVGVFAIWKWRQSQSASASSASTAPTTSTAPFTDQLPSDQASLATPGGFSYSGPASMLTNPSLQGLFQNPTPAVAASPSYSSFVGETLVGSGYGAPSGTSLTSPLSAASGNYYYVPTMANATSLQQSGNLYYQPLPGTFQLAPPNLGSLSPGTPLFGKAA